ncbi:MAG: GIY-YIG nuclease family protein [Deltaproteobacteria bacterium]|nr:GIY-YIG nuclease family protein [Deltaproteobacteria bacterium]
MDAHEGALRRVSARWWWVYALACADGSLYLGITNDLERRQAAHQAGRGGAYTRARRPVRMVWRYRCGEPLARRLEPALKRLKRAERLRLVAGDRELLRVALTRARRTLKKAAAAPAPSRSRPAAPSPRPPRAPPGSPRGGRGPRPRRRSAATPPQNGAGRRPPCR